MQLETITMPKVEARKAFLEYRRAVRARHNSEDEAIMRGYKALALGRQIINIRDALIASGFDEERRPRLAITRADAQRCLVRSESDGDVTFYADVTGAWNARPKTDTRRFRGLTTWPADQRFPVVQAQAIVPNVPPQYRPAHALAGYDVLWEAEWRNIAPRDPALLKHLGGDLYVVVAMWDLTPLEQAVIGGTRRA
jgi:hypothetical protein